MKTRWNIQNWLNKPYPIIERARDKLFIASGFGLFTSLFLWLYTPFGISDIRSIEFWYFLGIGLCIFFPLIINYFLLPLLFKNVFIPENWDIKKEVALNAWGILLIAFTLYLFHLTIAFDMVGPKSFFTFLGKSISIGIFPLLGLIYFTEKFLTRKRTAEVQKIQTFQGNHKKTRYLPYSLPSNGNSQLTYPLLQQEKISITPDTLKSPDFTISLDQFLFASSDNNYTHFVFIKKGEIKKELLRISLKNVAQQLENIEAVVRCHRRYIVNKRKIQHISGNARSLTLQLDQCEELIPVSRNFPKEKLV